MCSVFPADIRSPFVPFLGAASVPVELASRDWSGRKGPGETGRAGEGRGTVGPRRPRADKFLKDYPVVLREIVRELEAGQSVAARSPGLRLGIATEYSAEREWPACSHAGADQPGK